MDTHRETPRGESTAGAAEFEAIVIGTGFAGAVTACRLVEAGLRICVLERGRRYARVDFPTFPDEELFTRDDGAGDSFAPPPDFSRWLWARDQGIFDVRDLEDVVVVQAAGYGGGSLIYANVHLRPPRSLFERGWPADYREGPSGWPLEPYFDLAAYMLQVSLVPQRLAKTLRLQEAAHGVPLPHREGSTTPPEHWFRVPLAVNFDGSGPNKFGVDQGQCDMRGRCCLGCDAGAKNTLDMNYLERAERGTPAPDIRTLAEVTTITKAGDTFTVTYRDRLLRGEDEPGARRADAGKRQVTAPFVFLCAGAVNTTELLFRSSTLFPRAIQALGSHYFPNADSLAAVFDCDEPHEADYGPTITSALLFDRPAGGPYGRSLDFTGGFLTSSQIDVRAGLMVRGVTSGALATIAADPLVDWGRWADKNVTGTLVVEPRSDVVFYDGEALEIGRHATANGFREVVACAVVSSPVVEHRHWFLVEDGGYPSNMEAFAGLFRSGIWARRNRFVEPPTQLLKRLARRDRAGVEPPLLAQRVNVRAYANAAFSTFRTQIGDQVSALDLLQEQVGKILPKWFVDATDDNRKELLSRASTLALPIVDDLLNGLSRELAKNIDPSLLKRFGFDPGESLASVNDDQKEILIRGLLRQGLQVIAGGEVALAEQAARLLVARVPTSLEALTEAAGNAVLWALGYSVPDGQTGIALMMGRDLYRGRLFCGDAPSGRLTARLPPAQLNTSAVMQERLLREIAQNVWKGELRSNPAWAPLGKHVTVHSQGGCPMGENPVTSVTDPWGEVHDCPGLFVMDAAAFPTSVGVNPSATIAAVAELKVERFIHKRKIKPSWTARDMTPARAWVNGQRSAIDPLNTRHLGTNCEPQPKALGLTFTERMVGSYFKEDDQNVASQNGAVQGDPIWIDPEEILIHGTKSYRRAEDLGHGKGRTIVTDLRATVGDLADLIARGPGLEPGRFTIGGTMTLIGRTPPRTVKLKVDETASFLQLFVTPLRTSLVDGPKPVRLMRYQIIGADGTWQLEGLKVLTDEPGFDVLHDTSTVFFRMTGTCFPIPVRGILRVSFQDFLEFQLPSMSVTHTDDAARKSWALVAFQQYFAGELYKVYGKRAKNYVQVLAKAVTAIHV